MNFEIHNNDFSKTTGFHHLDNVDNHRRIVDTIKKVGIIRSKKQSTLYGTGWFISHSIVVTNAHVLDEIRNVKNVVFDLRCECKSSKTLSYHFKRQIEITDDDIQKLNLGSMKLDIAFLEISSSVISICLLK